MLTHKERFIGERGYAPSTIGTPQLKLSIDRKVFKSTEEEKDLKSQMKKEHKKSVIEYYGKNSKGFLNVPKNSLSHPIKHSF